MNYLETNALQWDKRTAIHKDSDFYDLQGFMSGDNMLKAIERKEVGDVKGKSLLHLQCHFGLDTLSWAKLGANVTGIDLSEQAIELAKQISKDTQINGNFIATDVYSVGDHLEDKFDIVFTSYGTIVWLDDLNKWAKVIADRLNPDGFFYMVDFHPLVESFDTSTLEIKYPYFNEGPIEEFSKHTYTDGPELNMQEVSFSHSFSEIFDALLSVGLQLEFFNEHDYAAHDCFENMEERAPGEFVFKNRSVNVPMMYSLKWLKR